jgi:UDP-2,3-diacylglucosamine pyrophosphatase LpxH
MGYRLALNLNTLFNAVRRRFGHPYWSLSAWLKLRVKNAVNFISEFEQAVAVTARERSADAVICGHIHHAESRMIDGIEYINDGDWVESCTALVEHYDGSFEIVVWRGPASLPLPRRPASQPEEPCESSSSPTPGTRKSTVSSDASIPSAVS